MTNIVTAPRQGASQTPLDVSGSGDVSVSGLSSAASHQRSFVGELETVADARMFTATFLASWGGTEHVEDVQLCVSELVTNSLIHGGGLRDGFRLRLTVSDQRLNIAVTDSGPGRPVRQTATWDSPSGRGLLIVNTVADRWGVEEHAVGKTVWAEFRRRTDAVESAEGRC